MDENLESSSAYDDSDVLMLDPFLEYLDDLLMEDQGTDDASICLQQSDSNYQAIFSELYSILLTPEQHHPQPPPNWCAGSMSYGSGTADHQHQILSHSLENGSCPDNHHEMSSYLHDLPRADLHKAIRSTHGIQMPTAVVEGLRGPRGREQGKYGSMHLASVDEEFSLERADIDIVSFEHLKLEAVHKDFYPGEPSPSNRFASRDQYSGEQTKSLAGKACGRNYGKMSNTPNIIQTSVDLRGVLESCAEAVAIGDVRRGRTILQELAQVHGVSANGTGLQRVAHAFSKALAVRLLGTGEQEYRAMSQYMPSSVLLLKVMKSDLERSPFLQVILYFANQSILRAAEGASRLHIVDYGSFYGLQWPCLIRALADREGGPPALVITAVEFPQPGNASKTGSLEEVGRRLASYAEGLHVPFQYHPVVSNKWEDLDAKSLCILHQGDHEVLVVNCMKNLSRLSDESVDPALITVAPRQKLLTSMRGLNPHLLVTAVMSATFNSTFFVSRFREALLYYSNLFDMLDTLGHGDNPQQRLIVEKGYLYHDILNVVACEGASRVQRPETYKQWHARISEAGFQVLPVPPNSFSRAKSHVRKHYHKEFVIDQDANHEWMLLGWKGRTTLAISTWKPARTPVVLVG